MKSLLAADNSLVTGVIPSELGSLRRLVELDISNTMVSGPVPSKLQWLANETASL